MGEQLKYKRILLKISGEALMGKQEFGIDPTPLEMISKEIKEAYDAGAEIAVVVGGGNIFRGVKNSTKYGMDQATGDYIGMLATVMNALALQSSLRKLNVHCRVQSAIDMDKIAEQNKQFALFTISFMQERLNNELEKLNNQTLELKDLPCIDKVVTSVKSNPNPAVRIAGISALSNIAKPQYKSDLTTIFELAKQDEDAKVQAAANNALDKLSK